MLTTQGKHLPGRRRSHQGLLCQKSAPLGLARCLSGVRLGLWPSPAHCLLQSPCLCQGQSLTVPSEQASLHFHDGTNFEMGKWHRRPQSPFTCRQRATATNGLGATPTAMPGTADQCAPSTCPAVCFLAPSRRQAPTGPEAADTQGPWSPCHSCGTTGLPLTCLLLQGPSTPRS